MNRLDDWRRWGRREGLQATTGHGGGAPLFRSRGIATSTRTTPLYVLGFPWFFLSACFCVPRPSFCPLWLSTFQRGNGDGDWVFWICLIFSFLHPKSEDKRYPLYIYTLIFLLLSTSMTIRCICSLKFLQRIIILRLSFLWSNKWQHFHNRFKYEPKEWDVPDCQFSPNYLLNEFI